MRKQDSNVLTDVHTQEVQMPVGWVRLLICLGMRGCGVKQIDAHCTATVQQQPRQESSYMCRGGLDKTRRRTLVA